MVAARKKRVPAPNSPKLPNVENLSRAGLKNRSNNITFHATYPPNYSKKVGAVILRIWYSIVRIEKEKSLASCGAFPALESPLLQNLMGKGAAAMPSNRNMTRTNESFIRVTQLPSFQSASPFVSANASIAHTNEALPPTSQVTCFHEDGRGHQGNPSPNSPEIKHKAAVPAPPRVFFPAEVLRKPRKIANPRQNGELRSVVKGFWWCWQSRANRSLTGISLLTGNLAGKSRGFRLSVTHGAAWHAAQFTVLSAPWSTIQSSKKQGIFSRYQGIEIPCYGFGAARVC